METDKQLRLRLRELFRTQNLAALSTHQNGQPYASLVAFYAADNLKHIYFATAKTTRKYANLTADHRVAVMVNNSTNTPSDFHKAISATAVGTAEVVDESEKEPILNLYLAKHPYLEEFVQAPSCALVRISVTAYYLVKNFQNVMEMHIEP